VIEIGSGFSSALMLDVNERFLDKRTNLTFIEPNPDRLHLLLNEDDKRRVRIVRRPGQETSDLLCKVRPGGFLFVDSSHVSKIGSDVNFICFEVLPNLPIGTFIHFHDIFWPFEYPNEWIAEGASWNEAYLLRAFLTMNTCFEIIFWAPFAAKCWPEL